MFFLWKIKIDVCVKKYSIVLFCSFFIFLSEAEERKIHLHTSSAEKISSSYIVNKWHDPFTTFSQRKVCIDINRSHLVQFPLKTIRLLGVLSSQVKKVALLQTPDLQVHRVTVGTQVGSSGGEICQITLNSIRIKNFIWPLCSEKSYTTLYIHSS
jgi:hypothetical protein